MNRTKSSQMKDWFIHQESKSQTTDKNEAGQMRDGNNSRNQNPWDDRQFQTTSRNRAGTGSENLDMESETVAAAAAATTAAANAAAATSATAEIGGHLNITLFGNRKGYATTGDNTKTTAGRGRHESEQSGVQTGYSRRSPISD